jgi:hypothetical protein
MSKSLVSVWLSILANVAAKSSGPMASGSKSNRLSRSARVKWASTLLSDEGSSRSVANRRYSSCRDRHARWST